MKFEEVRFQWTSGAACPTGIYIDRTYHLIKKNEKLYFSDGNYEKEIEKDALLNYFSPINCNSWKDVDFENKEDKKDSTFNKKNKV